MFGALNGFGVLGGLGLRSCGMLLAASEVLEASNSWKGLGVFRVSKGARVELQASGLNLGSRV